MTTPPNTTILIKACEYINKILLVKTIEHEFLIFKELYEIVSKEIKYPNLNNEVIKLLAKDCVYNDENIQ